MILLFHTKKWGCVVSDYDMFDYARSFKLTNSDKQSDQRAKSIDFASLVTNKKLKINFFYNFSPISFFDHHCRL